VIDFKVMKERLCQWLEDNWDHRFLLWGEDPWVSEFNRFDPVGLVIVGFNPTAELLADYLLRAVGPTQLAGTGVELISVIVEETRKCSAEARL
jgi:6-pyruvoyltetrahydropterin/6-carboxytetrahydropterin synthase